MTSTTPSLAALRLRLESATRTKTRAKIHRLIKEAEAESAADLRAARRRRAARIAATGLDE